MCATYCVAHVHLLFGSLLLSLRYVKVYESVFSPGIVSSGLRLSIMTKLSVLTHLMLATASFASYFQQERTIPDCEEGRACYKIGSKCGVGLKTYYCLGDVYSGMAWTFAPGEVYEQCEKGCFGHWDPKCGSDGITYQNQCYLENAMCVKSFVGLSHDGECIGPGACRLGCGDGYQVSYGLSGGIAGSYASQACGQSYTCVPSNGNCAKACPHGYYLAAGYDTTGIQYSSCGESIWCKPMPLMPSHCAGTFCRNNGYMTYSSRACQCTCLEGYYGDDCGSRYVDNCGGLSCSNNALVSANSGGCSCMCGDGFNGQYCQDAAASLHTSCGGMVCHSGGILTRGAQGCTCSCLEGFFGTSCAEHQQCKHHHCKNGGFVVRINNNCECSCPFGYYGADCELEHYGEWVAIQSRFYDLCLDHDINGNVMMEECEYGKSTQTWLVKGNYIMTQDERCLDIQGSHRTGNVVLWPCHYQTNQYFIIQEPAIKTFDKLCLDIEGGIFVGPPVPEPQP